MEVKCAYCNNVFDVEDSIAHQVQCPVRRAVMIMEGEKGRKLTSDEKNMIITEMEQQGLL